MKWLVLLALVFGFQMAGAEEATQDNYEVISAEEAAGLAGIFKWRCYAENRWGETWSATDDDRGTAAWRAQRLCLRYSRRCYRAGCERVISIPF